MPKGLILKIDPQSPDAALMERAVFSLLGGGLLVIPTETFYGIAVDSGNYNALTRLARLKERPKDKPFPLIISDASQLDALVSDVPAHARQLMDRHWPGPLSLVFPARWGLPGELVHRGGIAVRHSPNTISSALAGSIGRAITATSANLSGEPAPTSIENLDQRVIDSVDLILDAGPCPGGLPSTLADIREDPPLVLRHGAVSI